ncbi:MAG: hypothetical protein IT427_05145 [Pirellulales bacterium]|nr:hypothetical protein [Pirellulales bacterium]
MIALEFAQSVGKQICNRVVMLKIHYLVWSVITVLGGVDTSHADLRMLPHGNSPPSLVSGYFPDRIHEFVWRNWNAVEPSKLANILDTSVENVQALAASMGLPQLSMVPPEMKTRGYITLIRRNWHLLPYEQLLELLEMTPEQLAFSLREDDFLWIKLGQLKPKCEPLHYRPPGEAARRRAAEIRQVVEEVFGEEFGRRAELRFDFVRQLGKPLPVSARAKIENDGPYSLRFVYSYLAVYGDALLRPELDPYPDGFLQRLSAVGINGIWMHAVLRDLAPGGMIFPEFGANHQTRLANLSRLVERAKKYGIGVYLYLNEPRAMPTAFFKDRPELAGARVDEYISLCTSQPAVRQWMKGALTYVFREVPDLAGVYAITASENQTHCASHGHWHSCPRCKPRTDTEIIAEVAAVLEEGVHCGNPKAKVILSDWGWKGHGDAREIVARLPKNSWLMSVSEWDLPIERGGVKTKIDEYAISAVGPGPRAVTHWATAKAAGLKTAAEVHFNNTCEIASLPYLPVMNLVAEHNRNLASAKLDGLLLGWTMGGYPSPNLKLAERFNRTPMPDMNQALDVMARDRFGPEGAIHARHAWTLLSDAFREYPFDRNVVYSSPVQVGPSNPLYPAQTGYQATMWGFPYDDLGKWRGVYPPEVFAAQFEKVADGWKPGIAELQAAVEKTPPEKQQEAESDLRFARAAAIHFQSVANQAYFILARDALAKLGSVHSLEELNRYRGEIKRRLHSEIALADELFTLACEDSRIGFEPSCQYFYLPLDLVEKVINCRWLLNKYELEMLSVTP